MTKIKRVLISVSDKTGILEFARGLHKLEVEIISTGGTAKLLKEAKIPVVEVSEYTGFPEMLNGRVKTLHPKIHAGLLAIRNNAEHVKQLKKEKIGLIDMVVVNLYPFEKTIIKPGVKLEEAIENIDIGGPSMLRSAAKNYQSVAVVCNPQHYSKVLEEMKKHKGNLTLKTREELAEEVFKLTAHYDAVIYNFLDMKFRIREEGFQTSELKFPPFLELRFEKIQDLRYGENPHQKAAFYRDPESKKPEIAGAKQLHGKELSFNNILDLNAAYQCLREFEEPTVIIIKHTNPCGVASDKDLLTAYKDALECDPISAFGSIVGVNRELDCATAKEMLNLFIEAIIAPSYSQDAIAVLKEKKNLRLMEIEMLPFSTRRHSTAGLDLKKIRGGLLIQESNERQLDPKGFRVVTKSQPTEEEFTSLLFAWRVVKHVKSNAIVISRGTKTVGIGAGQMSRVDSVMLSVAEAKEKARGAVLASDAFFPKPDAVEMAIEAGVRAIIQPGGSVADEEIIKICNENNIAMIFTGMRHFRH
ncbi:bifunctional phosphoribosylaminoimidazolecarboxamide formyltransferase/IMP cyclohydrolase [Candidatus Desantisbacteria bacterium CG1_02_38_46]|uniref:Bifunctional purine biosynthesis protein PurH n=3 Tax=unclassified Candidatus Desantisiibacteriota TaxID=3106372 RepID=A0A2H9PCR2_9BACT|nr:MAG: bifunctional phosphoribosylaminoimidazolecarboxamide formyltransferase/IMP cyclohydrolase [Candidatus Desantisbacteria bacterium CG1_02_38_46]PIU51373.1 MAG: bifunctional phosphoribosylaminoimidazolecarboxamide formyltransferase/inosine monophosphate cyclohydrolase [Candidatus Desantisbacteria bacterium CG07_land_8_20_14_0_80_39_15]PIZ17102.1 MAG: bifunctional phosphoribosylaminoimidazolecarboxamide formyltransferase/inosine monophosphate cyclohydrolase [Candidatus Desantisbacteria bacter